MQYPVLVYKFHKGSNAHHTCKGGSFEAFGVSNIDEHIAALDDGWSVSLDVAVKGEASTEFVACLRAARLQMREEEITKRKAEAEKLQREIEEDERAAAASKKRAEEDELKRMEAEEKAAADKSSKNTLHAKK